VHSFVSAFLQAEELGAPLAETLNQIALDMRRDNAQRIRRKAQQTAPRVTLVTSFIFVPGTLVLMFVGFYVASGLNLGQLLKSFS
jgi:tight adherence protein C